MPEKLYDEIVNFRERLGGSAKGPVFTPERDKAKLTNRRMFLAWLHQAERHAGLRKMRMGAWHPYQRKWATERKHLPLVDVAAAGDGKALRCCLSAINNQIQIRSWQ